jgi:preprotein translocase subunit YajC
VRGYEMDGHSFSVITAIVWIVFLFILFYFLIYKPQLDQRKKHDEFLRNLKKGDKVSTVCGIIGEIEEVGDLTVILKICDGCKVKILKDAIVEYYEED